MARNYDMNLHLKDIYCYLLSHENNTEYCSAVCENMYHAFTTSSITISGSVSWAVLHVLDVSWFKHTFEVSDVLDHGNI